MKVLFICASILLLVASGCAEQQDPAAVVEQYLQAKVDSNAETLQGLLCSEKEADLSIEVNSFASVDASIEDMTCTREGESNVVSCTGQIVAVYGEENTEFPLASYSIVQEDGEWKWCGEAGG